ncbi:hypothetical protein B0T17DRAFT_483723 [Bombardia bombarda]|uniref:N-acetylgalactosaminide beta-1,3-galactosyltransferase n=1 Tax=Bombardia bombarda TaxID=252184 RepID=A0AA39XMG3_9PEZI|nr:hypothetical protein B0T17DRAFT_483723 [Bombardia bombarda]
MQRRVWPRTTRRQRRFLRLLVLPIAFLSVLFSFILPYDHPIRLAVYFNLSSLSSFLFTTTDNRWISRPPLYPFNWSEDIGVILKSGFGTQHRIAAWLDAVQTVGDVLIVADFETKQGGHYSHPQTGQTLPVHDAVALTLGGGALPSSLLTHPRVEKYAKLWAAINGGDLDEARVMCKSFGWELDAMKFISSLELAYRDMPPKKWYILVDDDTYIVQPSMELLLGHLDPDVPYYVGNAVGDYKARFAHGGSAILISHAAMQRLFAHPRVVSNAHVGSLYDTWGDRLLAKTLMKVGVYLNEDHSHLFNGERPLATKIRPDRICAPLVSFHSLASPDDMRATGDTFRNITDLVRWVDVWDIYGAPPLDKLVVRQMRRGWDHVGSVDEHTKTINDVMLAEECFEACERRPKCLAWTWEKGAKVCHLSPWMTVGQADEGKVSGPNAPRAKRLAMACRFGRDGKF